MCISFRIKDAQWHTDLTILHELDAALSPVACIKSQNLYHKSVTVFLIQDINWFVDVARIGVCLSRLFEILNFITVLKLPSNFTKMVFMVYRLSALLCAGSAQVIIWQKVHYKSAVKATSRYLTMQSDSHDCKMLFIVQPCGWSDFIVSILPWLVSVGIGQNSSLCQ